MDLTYNEELIDPFNNIKGLFVVRAEHFMRYEYAKSYLKKHTSLSKVVYDVASGDGYGTEMLSQVALEVFGFEVSKIYLERSYKESLAKNDLFILDNLDSISLESFIRKNKINAPTAIICFETLEHINNPQGLMNDFFNLLPENGNVIYSIPNKLYEPKKKGLPKNRYHKYLFSKEEITNLALNAGFEVKGVLGQPIPNILLHNFRSALNLIDYLSLKSEKNFKILSKILAQPTRLLASRSYSYIVVAEKKVPKLSKTPSP